MVKNVLESWTTYTKTDKHGTQHQFLEGDREVTTDEVAQDLDMVRDILEDIAINDCSVAFHTKACIDEQCVKGRAILALQKLGRWPRLKFT